VVPLNLCLSLQFFWALQETYLCPGYVLNLCTLTLLTFLYNGKLEINPKLLANGTCTKCYRLSGLVLKTLLYLVGLCFNIVVPSGLVLKYIILIYAIASTEPGKWSTITEAYYYYLTSMHCRQLWCPFLLFHHLLI